MEELGIKTMHLITGFLGGSLAIFFGKKVHTIRDKIRAFLTVVAGSVVTGFATPAMILWKPTWESAEHSIAFFIGLVGMGVIEGILNLVMKFKHKPVETIKEVKDIIKKEY